MPLPGQLNKLSPRTISTCYPWMKQSCLMHLNTFLVHLLQGSVQPLRIETEALCSYSAGNWWRSRYGCHWHICVVLVQIACSEGNAAAFGKASAEQQEQEKSPAPRKWAEQWSPSWLLASSSSCRAEARVKSMQMLETWRGRRKAGRGWDDGTGSAAVGWTSPGVPVLTSRSKLKALQVVHYWVWCGHCDTLCYWRNRKENKDCKMNFIDNPRIAGGWCTKGFVSCFQDAERSAGWLGQLCGLKRSHKSDLCESWLIPNVHGPLFLL